MRPTTAPPGDAEATVTLRFAGFDDAPDLLCLAQLDSAEPLAEPILVAEVAGRLTAALSLPEGPRHRRPVRADRRRGRAAAGAGPAAQRPRAATAAAGAPAPRPRPRPGTGTRERALRVCV